VTSFMVENMGIFLLLELVKNLLETCFRELKQLRLLLLLVLLESLGLSDGARMERERGLRPMIGGRCGRSVDRRQVA
jgi:hypothetical protein